MTELFLNGRVTLHCGDCLDVLATLPECSVDSVVTDPPYHLTSIVKRFGANGAAPAQYGKDGAYSRASAGFMGKVWDGGDIAFRPETWAEVLRVLKPGGHLLAFGGTRTFARMSVAIEDAGFEIRDTIMWLYGSGFPKSHDVSKGIDRAAGAEREIVGRADRLAQPMNNAAYCGDRPEFVVPVITAPATDAARQWEGWGTALKPAAEMITMARKPLSEPTVASNVLRWGTGAINVGACRVPGQAQPFGNGTARSAGIMGASEPRGAWESQSSGRWPANLIHDGSEEVVGAFPDARAGWFSGAEQKGLGYHGARSEADGSLPSRGIGDSGSAARFFYTAKADADDRLGSRHPTIKPVDLMQYLVRLVTPPGGVVLDPFSGTGTTGEAAWREGMRAILIEAEAEYQADTRRRMQLALAGPDERQWATVKAKGLTEGPGPLFDWGGEYDAHKDIEGSFSEAYRVIRARKAAGGPGWEPKS